MRLKPKSSRDQAFSCSPALQLVPKVSSNLQAKLSMTLTFSDRLWPSLLTSKSGLCSVLKKISRTESTSKINSTLGAVRSQYFCWLRWYRIPPQQINNWWLQGCHQLLLQGLCWRRCSRKERSQEGP
jgi:hypothetical protein